MKHTFKIIFALMLLNVQIYAQTIYPDESTPIDENRVKECQKIVDAIDAMQLKCDTILFEPFDENDVSYRFRGIYFDDENRLRKYFREETVRDGTHESIIMSAYYNAEGNLVYVAYDGSYHCGDDREYYFVHKGKIIDFMCEFNCECCEEDLTDEEIESIRPIIGSALTETIEWNMNLKNFIHAHLLLEALENNAEFE